MPSLCFLTVCVCAQVKSVVMINCGGCLNILEHLQPDEDVQFFVVDRYVSLTLPKVSQAPTV